MTDQRLTALDPATSLASTDLVYVVRDPTGTATNDKAEVALLSGGAVHAGETKAGVTPSNLLYPPGDVRRYGALSFEDGGNAADNTVAFQAAIDSANSEEDENSFNVFIPAGLWDVNGLRLMNVGGTLGHRVVVQGAGRDKTLIRLQEVGGTLFNIKMTTIPTSNDRAQILIEELQILEGTTAAGTGYGIWVENAPRRVDIRNVEIRNFLRGLTIDSLWIMNVTNCFVVAGAGDIGVYIGGPGTYAVNAVNFYGCTLESSGTNLYCEAGLAVNFVGGTIEGGRDYDVDIRSGEPVNFYGTYFESDGPLVNIGNPAATSHADAGNPSVRFDGCHFFNLSQDTKAPTIQVYGGRVTVIDPYISEAASFLPSRFFFRFHEWAGAAKMTIQHRYASSYWAMGGLYNPEYDDRYNEFRTGIYGDGILDRGLGYVPLDATSINGGRVPLPSNFSTLGHRANFQVTASISRVPSANRTNVNVYPSWTAGTNGIEDNYLLLDATLASAPVATPSSSGNATFNADKTVTLVAHGLTTGNFVVLKSTSFSGGDDADPSGLAVFVQVIDADTFLLCKRDPLDSAAGNARLGSTLTVEPSTDIISSASPHFLESDDLIKLSSATGGHTTIVSQHAYYAQVIDTNDFQVALTPGGAAIDIDGSTGTVTGHYIFSNNIYYFGTGTADIHPFDTDEVAEFAYEVKRKSVYG